MGNSMVKINVHLVFHIKSTSVPMHPMDLPRIFAYIGGDSARDRNCSDYRWWRIGPYSLVDLVAFDDVHCGLGENSESQKQPLDQVPVSRVQYVSLAGRIRCILRKSVTSG